MNDDVAVLIQARLGSERLPGKVLLDLAGQPMLARVRERAAALPDAVVRICTTAWAEDDPLAAEAFSHGWSVWRSDRPKLANGRNDVLGRLADAGRDAGRPIVVRLTADCPFVDPLLIAWAVGVVREDLGAATLAVTTPGWPDGLDVEAMPLALLDLADRTATTPEDREHVTPYLRRLGAAGRLNLVSLRPPVDAHYLSLPPAYQKWSVDTSEELHRAQRMMMHLPCGDLGWGWIQTDDAARAVAREDGHPC